MITSMIVAAAENDVIGRGGDLPWHISEDLKRFRRLTTGHAVVAGRVTHDSIVARLGQPLPERVTIVASRTHHPPEVGAIYLPSIVDALVAAQTIEAFGGGEEVFVIGGTQVYREAMPLVDRIHLTRVHQRIDGDAVMPSGWLDGFTRVDAEAHDGFTWETYHREGS